MPLEQARRLFREYVQEVERFWTGDGVRQADKLRRKVGALSRRDGCRPEEVVDGVLQMADRRSRGRPPPIYVTGLGASGSHWLGAMLGELRGMVDAGEVYFSEPLLDSLEALAEEDRSYIADCLHLLHAWTTSKELVGARIVNSAAGAEKIPIYRSWDPDCLTIYLFRDPRDQVMSATFRKTEYRSFEAPEASDREYLISRCRRNRQDFLRYRQLAQRADLECRYEELRDDTVGLLQRLLLLTGLVYDDRQVERVVFEHRAKNIRSGLTRPRGSNLDLGGTALGWPSDASFDQKRVMHAELVEAVLGLGYPLGDCLGRHVDGSEAPDRTMRFADGEPHGSLWISDSDSSTWRYLAPAQGEVSVPAGASLLLRVAQIDPSSLEGLTRPEPGHLQSLCLAGNPAVADETVGWLPRLVGLRQLDLARTGVTDRALAPVAKLGDLRGLNLWETKVTEAAVRQLAAALPHCEVFHSWHNPPA
jgi:hypothetical protein